MMERRTNPIELRFNSNSRKIEGKAICFNSLSVDLGGFYEIISPYAISQDLLDNSDIFCYFNHDDSQVIGRDNKGIGNLQLELREDGLYFSLDVLENPLGDTVLSYIRSGILNQCSFAFTCGDETVECRNGIYYRTINNIDRLFEISVVWQPAYQDTSVACRSLDKFKETNKSDVDEMLELLS